MNIISKDEYMLTLYAEISNFKLFLQENHPSLITEKLAGTGNKMAGG